MYYAVARLEFLVPGSRSLKEKRAVLNRLKARLQERFHVSVAEVDFQDLWQRAALGVAVVVSEISSGENALAAIRREAESDPRVQILELRTHVARLGDEECRVRDESGGISPADSGGFPA